MNRAIHVLHVDDNAAFRDLTAGFLERVSDHIRVHSIADPTAVLNTLDVDLIDCVVSDYKMPEMNGIELCWDVRVTHPDLPFFLFTSYNDTDIIDQAEAAGATAYLEKEPGIDQYTVLANHITTTVDTYRHPESVDAANSPAPTAGSAQNPVAVSDERVNEHHHVEPQPELTFKHIQY